MAGTNARKTRGPGKKRHAPGNDEGNVHRSFTTKRRRSRVEYGKKDAPLNAAHHGLLHGWSTHASAAESLEPLWEGRRQGWLHGLHQRRANYLSSSEDSGGAEAPDVVSASCAQDHLEERVDGLASADILSIQEDDSGKKKQRGTPPTTTTMSYEEEEEEEEIEETERTEKEEERVAVQRHGTSPGQKKRAILLNGSFESLSNPYIGDHRVTDRHHLEDEERVSDVLNIDDVAGSPEKEKNVHNAQNDEVSDDDDGDQHVIMQGIIQEKDDLSPPPAQDTQNAVMRKNSQTALELYEGGVSSYSVDDLNCAIIKKNRTLFQRLARGQHLLHSRDSPAMAPLICACRHGDDTMVKTLLEFGAVVNICDHSGKSPLMCAVERGNADMVKTLLDNGASVDQVCNAGLTALHYAVDNDSDEISEFLIEAGSDLDLRCSDKKTVLMKASTSGKARVVLRLLSSGSSVDIVDEHGQTALMSCLSHGVRSKKIISALIDAGTVEYLNKFDSDGRTALFHAITNGIHTAAELLLKSGCEFNYYCTYSEKYPLILAIEYRQHGCVSWMLRHGANPDCADGNRKTALMYAAELGYGQMVADLVNAGASINAIDTRTKFSALDYAAYHGHKQSARILLKEGGKTLSEE